MGEGGPGSLFDPRSHVVPQTPGNPVSCAVHPLWIDKGHRNRKTRVIQNTENNLTKHGNGLPAYPESSLPILNLNPAKQIARIFRLFP